MPTNDRAITWLTSICHGLLHAYELSIPVLMTVWLQELDVSKALLGAAVACGYGLFGLGALPGGILADRYTSKRLIIGCLLGMGGAFLLLGTATGLLLITGALVIWGAAASVYHPAALALISKGAARRGHVFAYHGIAGNVGTALGPLATTVLLLFFDWRVVVALLALPALSALPLASRLHVDEEAQVEETTSTPTLLSWSGFRRDTRRLFASAFVAIFAVVLCYGLYYRGVLTFLPELLEQFTVLEPAAVAGVVLEPARYVYVGLLLVGVGGQYVGGRLTDRLPLRLGLAGTLGALALVALTFLPLARFGLIPLLFACGALGFLLFAAQPLYQAAVASSTPAGVRGLSYGYTYLGSFGIGALGAAITGVILDLYTPSVLFVLLAVLAAIGGGTALLLRHSKAVPSSR